MPGVLNYSFRYSKEESIENWDTDPLYYTLNILKNPMDSFGFHISPENFHFKREVFLALSCWRDKLPLRAECIHNKLSMKKHSFTFSYIQIGGYCNCSYCLTVVVFKVNSVWNCERGLHVGIYAGTVIYLLVMLIIQVTVDVLWISHRVSRSQMLWYLVYSMHILLQIT